jgi:hypothetical protein
MPLRFRRRVRVVPGVTLNLNKRSISASFGRRGAHVTIGPSGQRTSIGVPGTGLSYTAKRSFVPSNRFNVAVAIAILICVTAAIALLVW